MEARKHITSYDFSAADGSFRIEDATLDDLPYFEEIYPDYRVEFYEDHVYCSVPGTPIHNRIAGNILCALNDKMKDTSNLRAEFARTRVYGRYKPHISVVCFEGAPYYSDCEVKAVVEVLGSEEVDTRKGPYAYRKNFVCKLADYFELGLSEVYVVNDERKETRKYTSAGDHTTHGLDDDIVICGLPFCVVDFFKL